VLTEHDVGLRHPVVQTVGDHRLGAAALLLGRLEQDHERARPGVTVGDQAFGRAEQAGDVDVVPAGVHHRHVVALGIGAAGGAGVRQPGLLRHRQPVHVRAQQHRRTGAVLQHADHAGATDAGSDGDAESIKRLGDDARGAMLLEGQFGVRVQVAINRVEIDDHQGSVRRRPAERIRR